MNMYIYINIYIYIYICGQPTGRSVGQAVGRSGGRSGGRSVGRAGGRFDFSKILTFRNRRETRFHAKCTNFRGVSSHVELFGEYS